MVVPGTDADVIAPVRLPISLLGIAAMVTVLVGTTPLIGVPAAVVGVDDDVWGMFGGSWDRDP